MKQKKLQNNLNYNIEDVQCPHCLGSLVDEEDKILLLFDRYVILPDQTRASERGVIKLTKQYRNYDLYVYGINQFFPGELVTFYCPHCKKDLMVQDEYFYFLVQYPDRQIEYAFMSAKFNCHFTVLASVDVAKKILKQVIDLAVYESIVTKLNREDHEATIRYYSSGKTFIP